MPVNDKNNTVVLSNFNLECFDSFLIVNVILKYMKEIIHNETIYSDVFNEIHRQYLVLTCYNKMDYISKFIASDTTLGENIKHLVKYHKI